ncbi:MAG: hypothetical protein JO023_10275 [Chloroflexi bacterium]|nr:hypothetical protein [Chloroflexota bacterium]
MQRTTWLTSACGGTRARWTLRAVDALDVRAAAPRARLFPLLVVNQSHSAGGRGFLLAEQA